MLIVTKRPRLNGTSIRTRTYTHKRDIPSLCSIISSYSINKGIVDPHVDHFTYSKPLVVENFLDGDSMIYISREHSLYEIFRRLTDGIPKWCLHLQIQLNRNYLPRMRRIPRPEWYERPEITRQALLKFLNRSFFIRISVKRNHTTLPVPARGRLLLAACLEIRQTEVYQLTERGAILRPTRRHRVSHIVAVE